MNKLLLILLISVITCIYDPKTIHISYSYLAKNGYLKQIKNTLFTLGRRAAIEVCVKYIIQTPEPPKETDSNFAPNFQSLGEAGEIPEQSDDNEFQSIGEAGESTEAPISMPPRNICKRIIHII